MASVDGQEYDTLQGTVVITDSVGTGTVVEVTKAAEGSVVNAPAGVQVMNESGVPIKVNAEEEPEGPDEGNGGSDDEDKPQTKPGTSDDEKVKIPKTGDTADMGLYISIMLAGASLTALAFLRKRMH